MVHTGDEAIPSSPPARPAPGLEGLPRMDMAALEAVKRLLQEEVQAFRFASSLGKEGGGPSRVVGNSTAPNAFLALMPSEADAENMQKWLGEVIDQVDLVIERADRNAAEYLTKLFGSLAQWAVQRSGSPGDRTVDGSPGDRIMG